MLDDSIKIRFKVIFDTLDYDDTKYVLFHFILFYFIILYYFHSISIQPNVSKNYAESHFLFYIILYIVIQHFFVLKFI